MSTELDEALAAIAEHGESTNAFIRVDADAARATAGAAEIRGPLHGMTVSIKDLIDIAGQPTTAASRVRAGHLASKDARVITRLRDAGAILIGKTNLHEFAFGTTSEESAFGPVRNPRDLTRSAGGSSGGSAAAVAAGMGRASIGSDTGGSIRIPAAACGVVGLKPSLGEVPTDGVVPLSVTLDHVGPLTRTVADAALIWSVIAAKPAPTLDAPGRITLGALGGYFTALLDADVRRAFDAAANTLRRYGVAIEDRIIDDTDAIVDTYLNISLPEAAHWHAPTLESRAADYQPAVLERIRRGLAVRAVDHLRAFDVRRQLQDAVDRALEKCDGLVLPSLAIVAPKLGATDVPLDNGGSVLVRSAMLRLTQLFNITGHPAISLPVKAPGLPVGLQLVGRRNETAKLLAVAAAVEPILMS